MVVQTVYADGRIDNHGYSGYWDWQAEFIRRKNTLYMKGGQGAKKETG